jgi:hypothetical protein
MFDDSTRKSLEGSPPLIAASIFFFSGIYRASSIVINITIGLAAT